MYTAETVDLDYSQASAFEPAAKIQERMRWLRANAPIYWSEKTEAFIISRFEDVTHVSKNNQIFCSGEGVLPGKISAKIGMIDEDEPRHGEMRGLINRGFTPRMVRHWEGVFKRITDEAIDRVAAKGECDFVEDIAVPLPLILIAEMIGIRPEDRERFHQWSTAMICPSVLAARTRVCDPVPQPTSRIAGSAGRFSQRASALDVDSSFPGPSRGSPWWSSTSSSMRR